MLEPTSGRVTIQGMDNQLKIEEVRHYLGFCPQYGTQKKTKLFWYLKFVVFLCIDFRYSL